jgi:hypothetical protein
VKKRRSSARTPKPSGFALDEQRAKRFGVRALLRRSGSVFSGSPSYMSWHANFVKGKEE